MGTDWTTVLLWTLGYATFDEDGRLDRDVRERSEVGIVVLVPADDELCGSGSVFDGEEGEHV